MKTNKLIVGIFIAIGCTQTFANDSLQKLHKESRALSEKEKVLYEKITDPNAENLQQLRCVELPKLAEQRISINERTLKLAPSEYSEQIQENNKLIKSKLLEVKKQFGC